MNLKVNGCCCMTLRTAGLVIGWLGIVSQALSIASSIVVLLSLDYYSKEIHSNADEILKQQWYDMSIRAMISIPFALLGVIMHGFLIKGIHADKHRFLLPWLIYNGIVLMFAGVMVAIILVASLVFIASQPFLIVMALFVAGIYGFGCWVWIAIYSLYEEIRMTAVSKPLAFHLSVPEETKPRYQVFDK